MKLIKAIIKPSRIDEVKEALNEFGISGMTIFEVKGYGRQKGHHELYRGAEYQIDFVPKVMLEIAVNDDSVADCMKVISEAAKTGKIGDGKVFVLDVAEAIRIRTGEIGTDALS
ncbi:MAG: transcriptional regulator [Denitrovibrio sp.]|nr:MAG: transcriptional regulator [Denitrovibrio sp.]